MAPFSPTPLPCSPPNPAARFLRNDDAVNIGLIADLGGFPLPSPEFAVQPDQQENQAYPTASNGAPSLYHSVALDPLSFSRRSPRSPCAASHQPEISRWRTSPNQTKAHAIAKPVQASRKVKSKQQLEKTVPNSRSQEVSREMAVKSADMTFVG